MDPDQIQQLLDNMSSMIINQNGLMTHTAAVGTMLGKIVFWMQAQFVLLCGLLFATFQRK